ncbi:GNAT family N-acetyltransferase [Williamsia deligens]|uniref:GNAT family N-acetyltransferase n=1 Tax=Williamsia deligens TaxID=321325 RepID=UPI0027E2CE27|nr:GNAT family N-acetyltransferase [Williamsia deligens]
MDTPHLVLRPVTKADVGTLVELDGDPEVMRYVSGGAPTPVETIADWVVPRALAAFAARQGAGMWMAHERRTGTFVGWFALRSPRHSAVPELELAYRLRRTAWGLGYGTDGSVAVVRHAFENGPTARVFAGTMAVNAASRRVMEKAGMRLAALHQTDDRAIDGYERGEVEYEILRADWEAGDPARAPRRSRHAHLIA